MRARVLVAGMVAALALAGAGPAAAEGWAKTFGLAGGSVALTNAQANTVWSPVAVLWAFDGATNATLRVERESQGNWFLLGAFTVTNGTCAVWIPEADYPFALGDVFTVTSTATNGSVQVIRKGG
jgi:hypothetical protein